MKNEPVGYVYSVAGEPIKSAKISAEIPNGTPLYTHPAKQLTDEEILKLYVNNSTYDNDQKLFIDIYGFARAILRKAQK